MERTFAVGDEVFLKLQPYIQTSLVKRSNNKLAFKFFGPYVVIARVGEVAYRLNFPSASRIHPVFHVSQLKPFLKAGQQVLADLPSPDDVFQVPVSVLQSRVRQQGLRTVAQVLVQWSGATAEAATWEDFEHLQQQFPHSPAWGQAGIQERGIVSDHGNTNDDSTATSTSATPAPRPRRVTTRPVWVAGPEWAH